MIRKRTVGLILCISGGVLALAFGKPVFKTNVSDIFALVDVMAVSFGYGLMMGDRK